MGGNALVSGGYLEYVNAPAELRVPMSDELTRQLESDLANPIAAEIPPEELAKIKDRYAAWQASGDTTLFDCEELMALQECLLYGADGYYGSLDFAQCVSAFDAFLDENGFAWKPCIGIVGYPWPHWSAPDDGVCGQGYFNFFDKQIAEHGYPVEIMLNTPVTELLKEGDAVGRLHGQVAEDGTTYHVRASRGACSPPAASPATPTCCASTTPCGRGMRIRPSPPPTSTATTATASSWLWKRAPRWRSWTPS